jgi:glycosyltransferase involved in cell wall biosynthesis
VEKHLVYFKSVENHLSRALAKDIRRHHIKLLRWGQVGCIARLTDLFRRIKPHVVQSHMFHTNLYVTIAARIAKVPVVLTTEHGKNLWKNATHHFIERYFISSLSTLRVAVSEDIKIIRIQTRDIPANKIIVIPPCVVIPDGGMEYRDSSPIRIGAVGRMVKAKDYPTLLQAFACVVDGGVQAELVFLGDGPERVRLAQQAS